MEWAQEEMGFLFYPGVFVLRCHLLDDVACAAPRNCRIVMGLSRGVGLCSSSPKQILDSGLELLQPFRQQPVRNEGSIFPLTG